MTLWFAKKKTAKKTYHSKSISVRYLIQHFFILQWKNNGAVKGRDSCYDLNISCLGIFISYTNWDYTDTSKAISSFGATEQQAEKAIKTMKG